MNQDGVTHFLYLKEYFKYMWLEIDWIEIDFSKQWNSVRISIALVGMLRNVQIIPLLLS